MESMYACSSHPIPSSSKTKSFLSSSHSSPTATTSTASPTSSASANGPRAMHLLGETHPWTSSVLQYRQWLPQPKVCCRQSLEDHDFWSPGMLRVQWSQFLLSSRFLRVQTPL